MPRPSVESATDLSDFFDTDEFALAASYTVTGGSAATVNVVFDEGHVAVDVGGQVQVANVAPQFQCATSDVSSAARNDEPSNARSAVPNSAAIAEASNVATAGSNGARSAAPSNVATAAWNAGRNVVPSNAATVA